MSTLSESAQQQALAPKVVDSQLVRNIKVMSTRFWKQYQKRTQAQQKLPKSNKPYRGEEIRYYCGHFNPLPNYLEGLKNESLTCIKCGMQWRGWMVIGRNKGLPKRELREAQERQYQREKSRPKGGVSSGRSNSRSR